MINFVTLSNLNYYTVDGKMIGGWSFAESIEEIKAKVP